MMRSIIAGLLPALLAFSATAQPAAMGSPYGLQTGAMGPLGEAGKNEIRNPRAEGSTLGIINGGGGILPTSWVQGTTTAQTITVIGTGAESGIPYIDIKIDASGAGSSRIQFENPSPAWAASTAYVASVNVRVMAGSLSAFSTFNLQVFTFPSAVATTTSMLGVTTGPLASQRLATTGTAGGSDSSARPEIAWVSSGAGSVTLRLGAPQLERGLFASAPMLPPVGVPGATRRATAVIGAAL